MADTLEVKLQYEKTIDFIFPDHLSEEAIKFQQQTRSLIADIENQGAHHLL